MSKQIDCNTDFDKPMLYQIRIKGHLAGNWSNWFEDASISLEDSGTTLITCFVPDQSALYGLLRKIRDLGMPLISVNCIESD